MKMLSLYVGNLIGGRTTLGKIAASLMFFAVPAALGTSVYHNGYQMGDDLPPIVVSSFSIFSAMLFASQVAAFSVFNYKAMEIKPQITPNDAILSEVQDHRYKQRITDLRSAFRRINAGISILTMISVFIVSLALAISASLPPQTASILTSALIALGTHFAASFLMICYHVYAFFDSAYTSENEI